MDSRALSHLEFYVQIPFTAILSQRSPLKLNSWPSHWLSSGIKFIHLFLFNKACRWSNYIEGTGSFLSVHVRICNQMSFLHIHFKFSFQSFIDLEVTKKRLGACGTLLKFKILRDRPISTSVICLYPLHKENYCAAIILSTLYPSINKESTREPGTIPEFIAESLT